MIKLLCSNPKCNYCYEVSQKELENNQQYHKFCIVCGSKMTIKNLEEIVEKDLYQRAREYIDKWINELGLEGCIELVERNREQVCFRIYKQILEERGLKIK